MRSDAPMKLDLGEFMLAYGKAWNDHDPDAIAALHTEDTRFCTHGFSEPAEGRTAMRAAAAATFERFPGFATEPRRVLLGADHWVLEWTVVDGDLRVDCVDVVTVEGDLVKTKDTYFDVGQLAGALGG
jgi:hypothetical protein